MPLLEFELTRGINQSSEERLTGANGALRDCVNLTEDRAGKLRRRPEVVQVQLDSDASFTWMGRYRRDFTNGRVPEGNVQ